jgi:hypothetical protein
VVRGGEPPHQRTTQESVFEGVEVTAETKAVAKVVPRPWFQVFFRDVAELWVDERAWRDSNPRPTA